MIVVKNHLKPVHVDDGGGDILLTIFFWLDDKNHLKPVHVDHGGGDSDYHAEQRWEKTDAAAEFDLEKNILKSSGFNSYLEFCNRDNMEDC